MYRLNSLAIEKLPYLLGEIPQSVITAARYVTCCHKKRATSEEQTPYLSLFIFPFVVELFAHMTFEMSIIFKTCECNV